MSKEPSLHDLAYELTPSSNKAIRAVDKMLQDL